MELLPKPGGSDSTIHFLPPDTSKGGEIGKQNKAEEALGESLIFASESPLAARFCSRERVRVRVCIGGGGERSAEARLCPCVGTSGGEGSAVLGALSTVVLNTSCTIAPPGELFKILMPTPCSSI